jgi:glycosyltransferase involved in cell wall biosynthesis
MEAMACGCAVVATAVGCIPVLHEGDNMRVAEPKDVPTMVRHLVSLIGDPEGCRQMAERGRTTICRYGWPAATAKLLAAIG